MAATIALAGMDPMRFLNSDDPFECAVMSAVAVRHLELRRDLVADDQAARIANAVGTRFGLGG